MINVFSQAQKEFTPSGCGGFFGGYRFIKTVSCFVACSRPIQMTEDILCSSRFFYFIVFSFFLITRFIRLVLQVSGFENAIYLVGDIHLPALNFNHTNKVSTTQHWLDIYLTAFYKLTIVISQGRVNH